MCFLAYKGSKSLYKDTVGQKTGFLPIFRRKVSKIQCQKIIFSEFLDSNMSQMIKTIILHGLCSHSEAYGSLWREFKKSY